MEFVDESSRRFGGTNDSLARKIACVGLAVLLGACAAPSRARVADALDSEADVASSAYVYRADRALDRNPPEASILLMQMTGLPFERPMPSDSENVKPILCGLLWEEVRPLRRIEFSWPVDARSLPKPDELVLRYFDGADGAAHTWWNPCSIREATHPSIGADGRTYSFNVAVDTWGCVLAMRDGGNAARFDVPTMRAFGLDRWKRMELEIEWGYDDARASLDYSGRVEAYDGIVGDLRALDGDRATTIDGMNSWSSPCASSARRGVRMRLNYIGATRWRREWPYHSPASDVSRTLVTLWTKSGDVTIDAADLEHGPILAPEFGFFVRAVELAPSATSSASPKDLLATKLDSFPGVPLVRGFASELIPWFACNPTDESGSSGSLSIPARSAAMHPSPDRDVAVGWQSPIRGRVALAAKVAMADAQGGNGIAWSIVREHDQARRVLAKGEIGTGGAQTVDRASAATLGELAVEPGDFLSLVIDAKNGDHICDTTLVEFDLNEIGGSARTWKLTDDVVGDVLSGNPHADRSGAPNVWWFYSLSNEADQPSTPPFETASRATSAREFERELASRHLSTIRERTREHAEASWENSVNALHGKDLPPHPTPPFEPAMQIEVPSQRLTAQWKLGAWHLVRHAVADEHGKLVFNDHPFGVLASETFMILRTLDLVGQHREAGDGFDQWLKLPMQPTAPAGSHELAKSDRPLGHFGDGLGAFTHASGPPGWGGNMDAVHAMGPGAILYAMTEHFRLTGDLEWLQSNAPRMQADAEWILRQRKLLATNLPNAKQSWSFGLQPAHVVTPDSFSMHMQFYESEAYYQTAVARFAELLSRIDSVGGVKLAREADDYRRDLRAAVDRSLALSPVVQVRDGTYHSFLPFAPYVRGFASGAWGWRRCQGHVGALYWDTVQSAEPLIEPARILDVDDPRVQGHLDVLEDRLLLENQKVASRAVDFEADRDWFAHGSWQYQCGLERHANVHAASGDVPNFLRSTFNQYAADILPGDWIFREHTTGGPPDKIFEEACFLERLRLMLLREDGRTLTLAPATPRAWLESSERVVVKHAPTWFGDVDYEIHSDLEQRSIRAEVTLALREAPDAVRLKLRTPHDLAIRGVTIDGVASKNFRGDSLELPTTSGTYRVVVSY